MIKEGVIIGERYEIMSRVGTGGMADVYKGRDHKLNRYVAVKVLKPEFREDELFVKKFQSEAQAAAGLLHPNVVNVYDVGEDRGLYYIVMELVEGITLKDYIQKKGRLTPKEVISITIQVCAGIDAAHRRHIVHRDIKPQNIIISKEGKVKVTDFGIAKATSSNTISTNAMGSVHYTSPEQARGGFSDEKSDVYSLGITMYEMATGQLPFDGDTTVVIALKHLQEEIVPPSVYVPDLPYSLERIILKCTQKSADRRYADMTQLSLDLRRSLRDPDGEFVVIAPMKVANDTVIMTQEEMERIQQGRKEKPTKKSVGTEEERPRTRIRSVDTDVSDKKQEEVNPNMTKIIKILTIVASVICVFIFVFVIGKATGIFRFGPGTAVVEEDEEAKVPKLVGLTEEEAQKACKDEGITMNVIAKELSDQYEEGLICSQKTQAGTKVPKNAIIQVVVSTGLKSREVELTTVKNLSEAEAKAALVAQGFLEENIEVIYREDDTVDLGKAIGTTPEAGEKATVDSKITLVISQGVQKAVMPRLVGKTKKEAEAALKSAGLKGKVKEEYSSSPEGEVIAQEIESGEKLDRGTTVTYTVSKGEEKIPTVTVPENLTGKTLSQAKAALKNLNLEVKVSYQESMEYYDGEVIAVPQAGSAVEQGTVIEIYVSTGPGPAADTEPSTP